ncbi:hypothetical protein JCM19236_6373 [Vibrio sp. JCM 19236]|nr:hypothetical protein JCM19236_6373 [Vibrio sp. JCM 19236]
MKFTIKNDLNKLIDDDVFVVLFFTAVVSVLGATIFRADTTELITNLVSWFSN